MRTVRYCIVPSYNSGYCQEREKQTVVNAPSSPTWLNPWHRLVPKTYLRLCIPHRVHPNCLTRTAAKKRIHIRVLTCCAKRYSQTCYKQTKASMFLVDQTTGASTPLTAFDNRMITIYGSHFRQGNLSVTKFVSGIPKRQK